MSTQPSNPTNAYTVPSVSITTARTGATSKANALGMRAMQERAYAKRGEQYLLIKSPPASGSRGALYALLSNPIYIGQIAHKDQRFPGLHEAIVDETLWQAIQAKLEDHSVRPNNSGRKTQASVLMGKIFDESGKSLTPSHCVKNSQRYRYYISRLNEGTSPQLGWRLPAGELEKRIGQIAVDMIKDRPTVAGAAVSAGMHESELSAFLNNLDLPTAWLEWVNEVHLKRDSIRVILTIPHQQPVRLEKTVAIQMRRRGVEQRLVIARSEAPSPTDPSLIKAIGRGMRWWEMLKSRQAKSISAIAATEGVTDRYVAQLIPLAMMSPKIIEGICLGQQAPELTTTDLVFKIELPRSWHAQQTLLRFS